MELIRIYKGKLVSAKDLYEFLEIKTEYSHWIKRTLISRFNEGEDFTSFLTKSTGGRPSKEYLLKLDTAKKLAMMAKTEKGDQARAYFIECEKTLEALVNNKRLEVFMKLEATKGRLLQNIQNIGGTEADYIQIDYKGCKVFFNSEPLPDEELPLILLKGRDFATEMTNEQFKDEDLGLEDVERLNTRHHQKVREMLIENVRKAPESFKPEENIKKLKE
ncbi:antA/AntB antirepressor family protein [Flexithrix dorotheae]|uniref:antA/AntB antirepressor family protein n=1 Tax=Flexithrix dorotheae TaxID=70993 RepID=UPI00036D9192|nr:antA/AntB antirepressor family protein [Flexithrix dorotheae]